jgi:hypothetical protein
MKEPLVANALVEPDSKPTIAAANKRLDLILMLPPETSLFLSSGHQ